VRAVAAAKGVVADGSRIMVLVGLGGELDDAAFYALSIPDAHELVNMVRGALDSPMPSETDS
jgi:hypothetical protein